MPIHSDPSDRTATGQSDEEGAITARRGRTEMGEWDVEPEAGQGLHSFSQSPLTLPTLCSALSYINISSPFFGGICVCVCRGNGSDVGKGPGTAEPLDEVIRARRPTRETVLGSDSKADKLR
ncbi:hypothetical protein PGTUg99_021333 [Puccinia graminis f. sp. tritici]|uniref:Uncharacterized protein n=1 Tax=Puccinia graminis f. sp. tritici TaxID=56615 RepID=A0A5B0MDB5_PUCGR|nr:hypothetical protein PGTUg99_021333 [Puccinia graminis f. sp. tritici]